MPAITTSHISSDKDSIVHPLVMASQITGLKVTCRQMDISRSSAEHFAMSAAWVLAAQVQPPRGRLYIARTSLLSPSPLSMLLHVRQIHAGLFPPGALQDSRALVNVAFNTRGHSKDTS